MSEWQPIETAPTNGDPILLWLDPPLNTNDALGYSVPGELQVVVGWVEGTYYGGALKWAAGFCEEGSADTEGHAPVFLLGVNPTHWMPLPTPPSST